MAKNIDLDQEDLVIEIPPLGVRKRPWRVDPVTYVKTNQEDLNRDLAEHSAKVAWIGQLYADCKYERDRLKGVRDRVEAELVVAAFAAAGDKKPTGKEIDAVVAQQEPYLVANEAYLLMSRTVDRLDGMRDTLNHRIQAMVSIGANLRREMDSKDPGKHIERINDKEAEYARLREERARQREKRR